jgi:TRAP-type C4-dicarboxylate transport system permease small subunit
LHFAIDLFIFLAWFVALHAVICMLARSHHSRVPSQSEAGQKSPEKMQEEHEATMKSYALLLAHTTAFAGIHCTWRIQHWIHEGEHGGGAGHVLHHVVMFLPIIGLLVGCFGLFRLSEYVRNHLVKGGEQAATDAWDKEAEEAENDIAVLALSFLVVQALRYCISEDFPNAYGVEHGTAPVTAWKIFLLSAFSLVFMALVMLILFIINRRRGQEGDGATSFSDFQHQAKAGMDAFEDYVTRWQCTSHQTASLCVVWCILYSEKWQLQGLTAQLPMKFSPNHTTMSVGLALFTSATAFTLIFCLDKIQDVSDGKMAKLAIPGIIKALAVLIGFAWEQSFDAAVEIIAEISDEFHFVPASVAKFVMALLVALVVVPQWRIHILSKTLELEEEARTREDSKD